MADEQFRAIRPENRLPLTTSCSHVLRYSIKCYTEACRLAASSWPEAIRLKHPVLLRLPLTEEFLKAHNEQVSRRALLRFIMSKQDPTIRMDVFSPKDTHSLLR